MRLSIILFESARSSTKAQRRRQRQHISLRAKLNSKLSRLSTCGEGNWLDVTQQMNQNEMIAVVTLNRQYPNEVNEDESVVESADVVRQQIHHIAGRCLCRRPLWHPQRLTINGCWAGDSHLRADHSLTQLHVVVDDAGEEREYDDNCRQPEGIVPLSGRSEINYCVGRPAVQMKTPLRWWRQNKRLKPFHVNPWPTQSYHISPTLTKWTACIGIFAPKYCRRHHHH